MEKQHKGIQHIGSLFDRTFTVEKNAETQYAHYVDLTAKLLKRPYMVVHKMVESWPLEKIIRHYDLATKHCGDIPQDVYWWWLRKEDVVRD